MTSSFPASAQNASAHPVKIIVPPPPRGTSDLVARIVADLLRAAIIATNIARRAPIVVSKVDLTWLRGEALDRSLSRKETASSEDVQVAIRALVSSNDAQRSLRQRALEIGGELAKMRWMVIEQNTSSIQMPFLVVLVFWLAMIAMGLGLLAPRNSTMVAVTLVSVLALTSAIFSRAGDGPPVRVPA